jgi:hypothetical protein
LTDDNRRVTDGEPDQAPPTPSGRDVWLPSTREGRWAVRFAVAGLVLLGLATLLIRALSLSSDFGVLGVVGVLAVGTGGAFATVAVGERGERALLVLVSFALAVGLVALVVLELAT